MDRIERAEAINQLKNVLDEYENPKHKEFENGFLRGIFYATTLIENGKEYADKKVDVKNP